MQRQYKGCIFCNAEAIPAYWYPAPFKVGDFRIQGPRVDDYAIADNGKLAANHARRQKRKLVGLTVDDQRVPCIVAALKAHNDVGTLRKPIDDLALSFIAPL